MRAGTLKKTDMFRMEYFSGNKHLETVCINKTRGFCHIQKEEKLATGRYKKDGFKVFKMK